MNELSNNSVTSVVSEPRITTVSVTNEFGLTMTVSLDMDKNCEFVARVIFSNASGSISGIDIAKYQVSGLIAKYREYVIRIAQTSQSNRNKATKLASKIKSFVISLRDVKNIKTKAEILLNELRRINVYTIDGSDNTLVAKTTIELDADIVSVINQPSHNSIINNLQNCSPIVVVHNYNIYLANRLFASKIDKFFSQLKVLSNVAKVSSIPFWYVINWK